MSDNPCMLYKHAEVADEYSRKQSQNAWAALRKITIDYKNDPKLIEPVLRSFEDEYMRHMYNEVPEAKWAKSGKWKYAKFKYKDADGKEVVGGLPTAYRSAKSVILNGIKSGMLIDETTGKSVVDTHLRSKKKTKSQLAVESFQKCIDLCNDTVDPESAWGNVCSLVKWGKLQ